MYIFFFGCETAEGILVNLVLWGQHFQVSDLRTETAEGLAKLMYTGRIVSAKMLSRLVLLWYNPVTEDDTRLRHCLGVFFQLYARESRSHMHTSYIHKQKMSYVVNLMYCVFPFSYYYEYLSR